MTREEILDYAIAYDGDYDKITKALFYQEKVPHVDYKGGYITINDEEYPKELLQLDKSPFVLFYKGDINLLKDYKISIVGSRIPSDYGRFVTNNICDILYQNFTLVSGMAKGIDTVVHQNVIHRGNTIGVLGCGIDYIYPLQNADLFEEMSKYQLLISEYPNKVKPLKHHFPMRNRIIAALGSHLIVTEAGLRSGTFTTCNEAICLNKEVYVVPYPLTDSVSGCNYLIQQGANIIYDYDVIKSINLKFDKLEQFYLY